jgi:hypothetical protein
MTQQSHPSQCSRGHYSSFLSFVERKMAVWVVSVWVVFGMKESVWKIGLVVRVKYFPVIYSFIDNLSIYLLKINIF